MKTAPASAAASPSDPRIENSRSAGSEANPTATKPTTDVTHAATSAPPMVLIVSSEASTGERPAPR